MRIGRPRHLCRAAIVAALAAVTTLAARPALHACDCRPRGIVSTAYRSDVIFVGTPVAVTEPGTTAAPSARDPVDVTFAIDRAYKGMDADTLVVTTWRGAEACGYVFEPGERYLVFAIARGDSLVTSTCTRTTSVGSATPDLSCLDNLGVRGAPVRVNEAITRRLIDGLRPRRLDTRADRMAGIGDLDDPELGCRVLRRALAEPDPDIRRNAPLAWRKLLRFGQAELLPVVRAAADPDPRVRAVAVGVLPAARGKPDSVFAALEAALADTALRVRWSAAISLGYLDRDRQRSRAWLEGLWTSDPVDTVRAVALQSLRAVTPTRPFIPILRAAARDSSPVIRARAARLLGYDAFRDSVWSALDRARLLVDPDSTVRENAAGALQAHVSNVWQRAPLAEILPSLEAAIRDTTPLVSWNAFAVLGATGNPEAARVAADFLDDPVYRHRADAIAALGALGPAARGVLPQLRRFRDRSQGDMRGRAEAAIAHIEGSEDDR
jgi:HEAT repeat protein